MKDSNHNHTGHDHHDHHAMMIEDFKKRFWISLIITIPIVVLAPMIQELLGYELRFNGDRYAQFVLSSIIFFYGGWPFLKGMVDEVKKKAPGMMTLIALAISVAYFYSSAVVFGLGGKIFFWELASLIVIMLLGHWIEMKSVMGASNALQELAKMMPSTARRIKEDGEHEDVSIEDLQSNDMILVRPGEKVPADGTVIEGESHVNESMLTGESKPVSKHKDDQVIGGSVNDNGTLKIKVKHIGEDSYLTKVIGMVKEAQKTKSKTQNLADKAASWLFYIALGAGITTLIVWLSLGKDFEYALERMVTVMIISCPHALGLAVPLVVAISTAVSAKNGLLIRNRTAFENARKISAIIFDKTGTLTKGEFGVTRFKSTSEKYSDNELLQIAASIENSSEHPIAGGIVKKAKAEGLELDEPRNFQNITGKGIKATLKDQEIKIVSPGMLKEQGMEMPSDAFKTEDETVVFILIDDKLAGFIALADEIRTESLSAIKTLKERGIKVLMATGDNHQVAKAVSEQLSLDDYYAEVLPEDKQRIIKELQEKGEFVAMTGDGVNDAPALAQANVGIAVGSGTDVAAETADIILVNSNPQDIANLILFGTATYKKMMQNLWWAAGYNIVAVPLAAGVLAGVGIILSPAVGAALMSLSTVVVAINAQLLKRQMKK
ncbi:copper-translocating P-type ATPase [Algoriphagus sp. C2-6-M1]|nr:copper-translocating P-type ATPase [Algoriphagus sp. C2-6-M1]MEB2781111.1 copper-translocating P-type ATPase [Algoriphagus sp. C2-6-M1]